MNINPLIRIGSLMDRPEESPMLVSGEGGYLLDSNGKRLLDLCGGIWNIPFGYKNSYINQKIIRQMEELPFCNLISNVAEVQYRYAERLTGLLHMPAVLFTCSGSEAVEAAVKACRQYQALKGSAKKEIAAFNLSYHGTSYGAMSVSGIDREVTGVFGPLLEEISWVETPHSIYDTERWHRAVEELFERRADRLAGFIVEPVIASGGVIEIPPEILHYIERLCRENDVLLIMDEVSTGFGRTGVPFVFREQELSPDLVCLSKGITNGYMPLGVLAFSGRVAGQYAETGAVFEHFSSQSGNLAAIAAADAVLDLMEHYEDYEVEKKGQVFRKTLRSELQDFQGIDIRGRGLMSGISFHEKTGGGTLGKLLGQLRRRGVLPYYFYNPGYNIGLSFFPPFILTEKELTKAARIIAAQIRKHPDIMRGNSFI